MNDDWRLLRGQDEYMQNTYFRKMKFKAHGNSFHAHCEFCWHKFMEDCGEQKDCSTEGYLSLDGKYWVCKECFNDFKDALGLHLENY